MLIRFQIENFLSFREKQSFSLIPGKGTLKAHHKSEKVKGVSALKTSVLYGANASGKSNLIKAIEFGKNLVLNGSKPDHTIDYKKFKLDQAYSSRNTYIEYEIQHKNKNYAYGFILNHKEVVDEWLYEIGKTTEKLIFERKETTQFNLDYLYKRNKKKDEEQFLDFTAKGTPRNQLFLFHIRNTNVKDNLTDVSDLFNVRDWFINNLSIIHPSSKNMDKKFEIAHNIDLKKLYEEMLSYFDTGIDGIVFKELEFEKTLIPEDIKEDVRNELLNDSSDKNSIFISNPLDDKYYIITKTSENHLKAELLMAKHHVLGGDDVLFDLKEESDGTRRIMDLIPLISDFVSGNSVFVIDELERSLHPKLVKDFLDFILNQCRTTNSQIIVSSHEVTLLDQELLRKDEIWFARKDRTGATLLHSLGDYNNKIRFDKKLIDDYLLGRFKGVPKIGNRENITTFIEN
jgi:hypothetical protein